ncbi:MAG: TetR family transcriptional regulator [Leptolyngbyaceae cyanobacterium SL_5_9]|nr:TetR family transcriptional regulator [Leptolyngbyaceae cyanobacterium SL_5_9]NJO75988.1 TetR family transcriptional regulator [Leptolyngbyaceae cyanobacterium RM1_406_9]
MSYDNRRLEVTEAAWRVIVREGLDRASMRAIAQELGSSTGVVTHYFRDKDELMLLALERVFEKLLQDMETAAKGREGFDRLEQMILAALPTSVQGIPGWQVWIAFLGYAIGRENLVQEHRKRYDSLCHLISQELAKLQAIGLIRAGLDLTQESNALIALVDGIGTGVVINPEKFSAEHQQYLVHRYLSTVLAKQEL